MSIFEEHLGCSLSEDSIKKLREAKKLINLNFNLPHVGEVIVRIPDIPENDTTKSKLCPRESFELELEALVSGYRDLLFTRQCDVNANQIRKVYCKHALNHVLGTRRKITTNNQSYNVKYSEVKEEHRDQGFTRPKVLFLLPFRDSALKVALEIISLLDEKFNVSNLDRLQLEFGDEDFDAPMPENPKKPIDYYQTFRGNIDDAFRVGMKLTKKSLQIYTDFYNSDIIIASPLGLKTLIEESEDNTEKGDADFLSSIELFILDQADIFLMQNWEHVLDVTRHLNRQPNKARNMDILRVRMWALEGWSKHYVQTLMFSSISSLLLHGFFQKQSNNYRGQVILKEFVAQPEVKNVTTDCRQSFMYFEASSPTKQSEERFNFFINDVLKRFKDTSMKQTLICTSSYFDYVRLRNYFRKERLSFTQICEYSEKGRTAKARNLFFHGARHFMLYTERCHFYHRYKIKGMRHLVFYEPPVYGKFYSELANMLSLELQGKRYHDDESTLSCTILYSKFDLLQLGPIVGIENAVNLIKNKRSILN